MVSATEGRNREFCVTVGYWPSRFKALAVNGAGHLFMTSTKFLESWVYPEKFLGVQGLQSKNLKSFKQTQNRTIMKVQYAGSILT